MPKKILKKEPPVSESVCFKEWACVVKALSAGEQILIFRKGGIDEESGEFKTSHSSFLLFPTYEHQRREELTERGAEILEDTLAEREKQDPSIIPIEFFCRVENFFWIKNINEMEKLSGFHIYSEGLLRRRFDWGAQPGLHVMLCRVFRLSRVYKITHQPSFSGCRSWIHLPEPALLKNMKPVLSGERFLQKSEMAAAALDKKL